ncbi:MAG: type II CRISPR RNA-guided endonuclease Cas9 [Planctomycetota bacterium]
MKNAQHSAFALGLDIGVASIGWAIIDLDEKGKPLSVRRAGTHLFDAGIDPGKSDPETALLQGREQSKAAPRRNARAMRRQTWRRARRKRKLLRALMAAGLLSEASVRTPPQIDEYLKRLDLNLAARHPADSHVDAQTMPYRLRAAAAIRPVERDELGRALYHLAQRRGFLSNRKSPERADEDNSAMKQSIGELATAVAAHKTPTLGAYLASLDPDDHRIRGRWTSRGMYLEEFERIWSTQAPALKLTKAQRADIHAAIFYQRPLKDQGHLIGRCSLVEGNKRCPIGERIAQRFRVFQQVNHLRVVLDDATERPLTKPERDAIAARLLVDGDLTVAKARRAAELPKSSTLSIERGGERRLVGHRTDAKLRVVFGSARWDAMNEADKDAAVHALRSFRDRDALRRHGARRWSLESEAADAFADTTLEEGHAAHCREALEKLVVRMERDGLSYSEARKDEYPESFASSEPVDVLPPLGEWEKDLRNPSVARALTELRKVVNTIVRRWGKPERVHLELARDLKASRSRREDQSRRMRNRENDRERAAAAIVSKLGIHSPKRWMIEKWLLAEECGWVCPYTGRHFGAAELLGVNSQYDVEHVWPMSQSLDNSYMNKTICYHEENRNRKKGRSPSSAYSAEELAPMLERVRSFKADPFVKREKLRRFTDPVEHGFSNRHLQETRYIGRMACDYIGLLYGGRAEDVGEATRRQRIVTPSGGLTAWLRRGWGLDAVLSDDDGKNRDDHRHHAIDAIVVACADQDAIKRLSDAAQRMESVHKHRPFDSVDHPWEGFVVNVATVIEPIVISRRVSKKIRGGLHKDTIYSKPHRSDGRAEHHRTRTELAALTTADLAKGRIIDKRAEAVIRTKLEELGEANPAKAFKDPANLPSVRGRSGRPVKLRRVRVAESVKPTAIGRGPSERRVKSESNYLTVVYQMFNARGGGKWVHKVVPLLEAAAIAKRGGAGREDGRAVPIRPSLPPGARVLFTLTNGECLEMEHPKQPGVRDVFRVLAISNGEIKVVRTHDGRSSAISGKDRIRITGNGDNLRKLGARKVRVTLLGEVVDAGG